MTPKLRYKLTNTIGNSVRMAVRAGITLESTFLRCLAVLDEAGEYRGVREQIVAEMAGLNGEPYEVVNSVTGIVGVSFDALGVGDREALVAMQLAFFEEEEVAEAEKARRLVKTLVVDEDFVDAEIRVLAHRTPRLTPEEFRVLSDAANTQSLVIESPTVTMGSLEHLMTAENQEEEVLRLDVNTGTYSVCIFQVHVDEDGDLIEDGGLEEFVKSIAVLCPA